MLRSIAGLREGVLRVLARKRVQVITLAKTPEGPGAATDLLDMRPRNPPPADLIDMHLAAPARVRVRLVR